MNANSHECDHNRGRGRSRSSAITVCRCCRDFLCSICGITIEWHEGLCVANPGVQWRYCAKYACVEAEAAYHALPFDEMIRHRDALRAKRVRMQLQDRGIEVQPPPSDTLVTQTTAGGAQRILITPRAFVLDPGEACWCNLGKDCTGSHEVYFAEPVNHCGLCGQTFRIAADDPHWSTGRGPICPTRRGSVSPLSPLATIMIRSAPLDASELSLATVRDCTRAFVRSGIGVLIFPTWSVEVDNHFTWRGLTGLQLGILDVWAEAHRGWTTEDGPISMMGASIADAVDSALCVLDVVNLDLPLGYRSILAKYAASGPQESVRDAVRALLAAVDTLSKDTINSETLREI